MVNETIRIYCRIKPSLGKKSSPGSYEISHRDEAGQDILSFAVPKEVGDGIVNNKREQYTSKFRKVFDKDACQDEVFDEMTRPVVDKLLEGFNGTVFAYGQTGSGKTYTVTGGAEKFSDRGLIPRTLSYIFQKRKQSLGEYDVGVAVSYLEIYNEAGFDLLDPKHDISKLEDLPRVSIMEDNDGNIHLRNLSIQEAQSEEEALNLLFLGDTNRMIAETPMNQASTRSHCIFTLHLAVRKQGSDIVRRSKMHLVDLAGSERVAKSGVSGQLLTEAKYINLSLHYLEQVIVALSEHGRSHVPYRNSLMTSVLRDSLGGNCITSMIATCSIDKSNIMESISTCRFAQRVALVKNDAFINEEHDPTQVIARLKREVQQLRDQLNLGENESSGDLTPDEIERCERLVREYLQETTLDSDLPVRPDMRQIQYCFKLIRREMKSHVCQQALPPPPAELPPQRLVLSELDLASLADPTGHLPPEVVKLKQIVQQRDNEISVLTSMLKREREKTKAVPGSEPPTSMMHSIQMDLPLPNVSTNKTVRASTKSFDDFLRDHPQRTLFEKQKEELKRKYNEAKQAGDRLSNSKNRVSHIKSEIERVCFNVY